MYTRGVCVFGRFMKVFLGFCVHVYKIVLCFWAFYDGIFGFLCPCIQDIFVFLGVYDGFGFFRRGSHLLLTHPFFFRENYAGPVQKINCPPGRFCGLV